MSCYRAVGGGEVVHTTGMQRLQLQSSRGVLALDFALCPWAGGQDLRKDDGTSL